MALSISKKFTLGLAGLLVAVSGLAQANYVNESFQSVGKPTYTLASERDVHSSNCELRVTGIERTRLESDTSTNPRFFYRITVGHPPGLQGKVVRYGAFAEVRDLRSLSTFVPYMVLGDETPLLYLHLKLPPRNELQSFALFADVDTGNGIERIWYKNQNGQDFETQVVFKDAEDESTDGLLREFPDRDNPIYWGRP